MPDDVGVTARAALAIETLAENDPVFITLCKRLYGDNVTVEDVLEDVSKMNDASEVHVNGTPQGSRSREWALRLGVLGADAGVAIGGKEIGEGSLRAANRELHVKPRPRLVKAGLSNSARARGAGRAAAGGLAVGADIVADRLARSAQRQDAVNKALGAGIADVGIKDMVQGGLKSARRVTGALMDHTGLNDKLASNGKLNRVPVARGEKVAAGAKPKAAHQMSMFDGAGKPGGSPNVGGKEFPTAASAGAQSVGGMLGAAANKVQGAVTSSPQAMAGTAAAGALGVGAGIAHHNSNKSQQGYFQQPAYFSKRTETVDVEFTGRVAKFDDEKRLAFGWASVSKLDGRDIGADKQGDHLAIEDTEVAAYDYNLRSRKGGMMHLRTDGARVYQDIYEQPGDEPVHVSDLVESMVFTPEKKEALGLPETFPEGWWVGFRYQETPEGEVAWQKVRKGEHPGFSIHGRGIRVPIAA